MRNNGDENVLQQPFDCCVKTCKIVLGMHLPMQQSFSVPNTLCIVTPCSHYNYSTNYYDIIVHCFSCWLSGESELVLSLLVSFLEKGRWRMLPDAFVCKLALLLCLLNAGEGWDDYRIRLYHLIWVHLGGGVGNCLGGGL